MRSLLFTLPFFAAASVVVAQVHAMPPAQFPVPSAKPQPRMVMAFNGCPVGFSARQRGVGQTLWTVSLEDKLTPEGERPAAGPGVHVEIGAFNSQQIKQVKIVVDVLPAGTRLLPVAGASADDQAVKTFEVAADGGASLKLASDLLLGPVAGVKRVRLLHVDYTDGTSWSAKSNTECSVKPNRWMLVGQ